MIVAIVGATVISLYLHRASDESKFFWSESLLALYNVNEPLTLQYRFQVLAKWPRRGSLMFSQRVKESLQKVALKGFSRVKINDS
jgi:putative NIF3 family GTP cyclohydrolase 1 type 2